MNSRVELLPADRIVEAVTVLSRAFRSDPIFSHYFPDPVARAEIFGLFVESAIRANLRLGHVYAALRGETIVGAAVWRPPMAAPPDEEDRRRDNQMAVRLKAIDKRAAVGLLTGFARTETEHPDMPHWYLFFVGLDPAVQGQAMGDRLLAPVLEAADRDATACYLETPFSQTHPFYHRLGFEIMHECRPFDGAPPIWTMLRQPRLQRVARNEDTRKSPQRHKLWGQ